jgi:hypothetical protein
MMTERELQRLIEDELWPAALADAVEFAADLARLAAVGLVEITRTASGQVSVGPRDPEM